MSADQPSPNPDPNPTPDPDPTPEPRPDPPPAPASGLARIGMMGALGLSFITIVAAVALCLYLLVAFSHGDVNALVLRLLLSSIACFIAVAFGILGFALFLIQAEGSFKGTYEGAGKPSVGIQATAPGLIVFICATVILYFALRTPMTINLTDGDPLDMGLGLGIDAGVDAPLDAGTD